MAHLRLDKVLAELPGVKKDGAAFLISEELDVTLYATLGQENLQIARVSRVDLASEVATILTHKGERFFLPPELFVALKASAPQKTSSGGAGFRA
jgi:hypothetical protein